MQDDFKIKRNLTVNWEYAIPYFRSVHLQRREPEDALSSAAEPVPLAVCNRGVGGNLYNAVKSNFGPQFWSAGSPTPDQGKVVVRAGLGLNFTGEEFRALANGGTNPPLVIQRNFSSVSPTQINP